MISRINKPFIRRKSRCCIEREIKSKKCMFMKRRVRRRIKIDVVLIYCCFQGIHLFKISTLWMTISPTKVTMTIILLTFRFLSLVTIRSRNWIRGFGSLVLLVVARIFLLVMLGFIFMLGH
jgi:hypothetical protein